MITHLLQSAPSILDNDFYKFTMQQAVVRLFPSAMARYSFINRGKHRFPEGFGSALQERISEMAKLRLTNEEKNFLKINCPYLDPLYLDFLAGYRYDPNEVNIVQNGTDIDLHIEGHWYRSILWEVPIMALICELYYEMTDGKRISDEMLIDQTVVKAKRFQSLGVNIAEFGTRRRHSYHVQKLVIDTFNREGRKTFVGTSNVHFAMLHQTKPIGTHAHEWFMYHAAVYGFPQANATSLQHWVDVFRGDLGIALSDTYTTDVFLSQFDKMFSKLFDGVRQDSGKPIEFADKIIAHYNQLGIDPLTKIIIFSDGLDYEKVARITDHCRGKIGFSFGIGTNLSNDVGLEAMNIVIKMTQTRQENGKWMHVVKLSDNPDKNTGNADMIAAAKTILNIEQ
ncbi:nicotinate phosphoribosyltransferase [Pedobacter sp. Leaf216]|uniref:nicotinate phosphoribosyltransferase n=1 Tax=Pedobacter sp. Leaf216 TaxID=1735684 RepID=UPI0006F671CC|nr:nicotinate phosphoribosyltransferase [Pedobacter sp. Leaf216]KQM69316.1 nicotinate phosphoribosyltransferase [Pedobacter sp. Leaf216]